MNDDDSASALSSPIISSINYIVVIANVMFRILCRRSVNYSTLAAFRHGIGVVDFKLFLKCDAD